MPPVQKQPELPGTEEFLAPDAPPYPPHFVRWIVQSEGSVDFASLRAELHNFVTEIEPIKIPSREQWEVLQVLASLGLPFDYRYYWALHFYRAPERFRKRVEDFNAAVERSGLTNLARDEEPDVTSPAAIIRRGINESRISSAFLNSWCHMGLLFGHLLELRAANEEFASVLKAGAHEAVIGQRVWYARWLVVNASPLNTKRQDAESELADLCGDVVHGRRKLPDEWLWKKNWFSKLLPGKRKALKKVPLQAAERGADRGQLASRFTRLSNETVEGLAAHEGIAADLLPPLTVSEFPDGRTTTPRGG
jgi:hypothetical protein